MAFGVEVDEGVGDEGAGGGAGLDDLGVEGLGVFEVLVVGAVEEFGEERAGGGG